MACSRCGKKAQGQFIPASTAGQRPRPALRQRPVARQPGRFAPGIQPAQQPAPPKGG